MQTLWFWLVALVVVAYVVLDGYDLGAGALHFLLAKDARERGQLLAAIGPYWDGNEVWLLLAGGAMFLAFPAVLAASFSGFYLAFWLAVWSLMVRGVAIEFRSHVSDSLWRSFWDAIFFLSSAALPIVLGAALGNVLRGVPLGSDGWFEISLFTDFSATGELGILDWFTVLAGIFALLALMAHGATFLAWKTDGELHARSVTWAKRLWLAVIPLWLAMTAATYVVAPAVLRVLPHRPLAMLALFIAVVGIATALFALSRQRHRLAFIGSAAFLVGVLAATAACVFPVLLRSTVAQSADLTAFNASADHHGLVVGLTWWLIGLPLVIGYVAMIFWLHRGKTQAPAEDADN